MGSVTRTVAFFGLLLAACAGSGPRPVPTWIAAPPSHTSSALVFVGQATGTDRGTARELAVGRALTELSKYCGATVSSRFELVDAEIDGRSVQTVEETVTVAGETLSLERVRVEETVVEPRGGGGYDAYARIRWPRSEYARLQKLRQERALSAVEPYLAAEDALGRRAPAEARRHLNEARTRLGDNKAEIPLGHPRFETSGALAAAIGATERALNALEAERTKSLAVGVDCRPAACPDDRVGRLRKLVTEVGLAVASRPIRSELVRAIGRAASLSLSPDDRATAFMLAVTFDVEGIGEEDGFVFARCGARAVLFDTDEAKIVEMTEVRPQKGGHLHLEGATSRACRDAETEMNRWLGEALTRLPKATVPAQP